MRSKSGAAHGGQIMKNLLSHMKTLEFYGEPIGEPLKKSKQGIGIVRFIECHSICGVKNRLGMGVGEVRQN